MKIKNIFSLLFNIFLLTVISFSIVSCENQESINYQLTKLRAERTALLIELNQLKSDVSANKQQIEEQKATLDELELMKKDNSGVKESDNVKHIVKFKLKQSHISLSISKHIKDAANAIEFEMPVDKEYYDKLEIGQNIVDEFRIGSAILYGSFGSWKMTVLEKRTE